MVYPWQDEIWQRLLERRERLPHALLFYGPPGIGKRALAEHFARLLLCEGGDAARSGPCGVCGACRWAKAGQHPDLRIVEPDALTVANPAYADALPPDRSVKPSIEIKIDQIRDLAGFLNVGSHRGGRRVALVHPAEEMNQNAANALLKGLEEPPTNAFFILVSHRPARLLQTIRSRCVAVAVPIPSTAVARAWLGEQGIEDPGRWLQYTGSAPLRARHYATAERGAAIDRLLESVRKGDRAALRAWAEQGELDEVAEALHKLAIDQAIAAFAGRRKYAASDVTVPRQKGASWLTYARQLGRQRALIRHPLNPRLFVTQLIADLPDSWNG